MENFLVFQIFDFHGMENLLFSMLKDRKFPIFCIFKTSCFEIGKKLLVFFIFYFSPVFFFIFLSFLTSSTIFSLSLIELLFNLDKSSSLIIILSLNIASGLNIATLIPTVPGFVSALA